MSLSRVRRASAALALLFALAATSVAQEPSIKWEPVWEHWYTLELAESTAGWMRESAFSDESRYRSESEMSFKISRGALDLHVVIKSETLETHAGEAIRYRFVQDLALQSVETVWEFGPETVTIVSTQGEREVRKEVPRPAGPWLTPMAVNRFWEARREAAATLIEYFVLEGEYGMEPVAMRYEHTGEEQMRIGDREIPVTVWKSTTSAMPGMVATTKMSDDGHLVYEEAAFGFGRMVTRATTKDVALASEGAPAPELMLNTFVPVDRPIARPRATTTSVLRARVREGEMPQLPSAGAQRVEPDTEKSSVLLRVSINESVPAPAGDAENVEYREASAMVNHDDVMIQKLASRACRGVSADPFARAEAMRRSAHDHISAKSLDTAFASASETARTRTGDCSEHGVLLCAMLRADGIPARVATGLVYADQFAGERDIFGWHMWTQALIDGRWVDFDATLERRYDAAHLLTGTSSLADGAGSGGDMSTVMRLIGNLEIDVVDVAYD